MITYDVIVMIDSCILTLPQADDAAGFCVVPPVDNSSASPHVLMILYNMNIVAHYSLTSSYKLFSYQTCYSHNLLYI